jgi:tetratricopeptide (TPR) repeat protein
VAPRRIDTEIDRLYQLPPDEFTAARNALAKEAGADGADVRRLAKPPIAAWAVNQIYWKRQDIYDALIAASTELRKLHKAILAGRRADIREATSVHDEAIDAALKTALAILREEGHPVTDATRQAILITLRSLPADDPPGRLTRTLQPGGFEMLAGLSIAGSKSGAKTFRVKPEAATQVKPGTPAKAPAPARTDPKATAQAKAAHEAAARAVREAEQAASRAEFEAARFTREAAKAVKEVEQAREALEAAQQALEDAKAAAATTARARETAERRAKEAERALDAARRAFKGGGRS